MVLVVLGCIGLLPIIILFLELILDSIWLLFDIKVSYKLISIDAMKVQKVLEKTGKEGVSAYFSRRKRTIKKYVKYSILPLIVFVVGIFVMV